MAGTLAQLPSRRILPARTTKYRKSISSPLPSPMVDSSTLDFRTRTITARCTPIDLLTYFTQIAPSPVEQKSAFLTLPAELRVQVYRYVFKVGFVRLSCPDQTYHCEVFYGVPRHQRQLLALLQICRQCYIEAKVAFNATVEVQLSSNPFSRSHVLYDLPTIPARRIAWRRENTDAKQLSNIIQHAPELRVLTVKLNGHFRVLFGMDCLEASGALIRSAEFRQQVFGNILTQNPANDFDKQAGDWMSELRKCKRAQNGDIKLLFEIHVRLAGVRYEHFRDAILDIDSGVLKLDLIQHFDDPSVAGRYFFEVTQGWQAPTKNEFWIPATDDAGESRRMVWRRAFVTDRWFWADGYEIDREKGPLSW